MKQEWIDLAKYRLEKTKNTLLDAKQFIGKASLESVVNRIYYSAFYAVNALLIAKGLSSSKHSGVRSLFNKEVVKNGLIEKQYGKFYSDMYNKRQKGDYQDFVSFEEEEVKEWLGTAEEFINRLEKLT